MPTDTSTRAWRGVFSTTLLLAMAAATAFPIGLGVIAPFIRDDLAVSRAEVGALLTVAMFVAALLSPGAGRVTDGVGGRRAVVMLFVFAAASFIGLAGAPSFWWMLPPAAIAALAQAGGNPTTNKLIATHVPAGRRGVITGIKQSGVQAGTFVAGLALPVVAAAWGWRVATLAMLVVPVLGVIGTVGWIPPDHGDGKRPLRHRVGNRVPPAIGYLAAYGALMGFGAAYTFLLPLFVEESLGMSKQAGGVAAGLIGLVALFSRIAWSRHADRTGRHDTTLATLAVGSLVAVALYLAAQFVTAGLLWVAVVVTGLTSSSWNSVGMLAVIDHSGPEESGRASGIVMLGFLSGIGIAPTFLGWLVDRFDSYTSMWLVSLASLGSAAVLSAWWLARARRA